MLYALVVLTETSGLHLQNPIFWVITDRLFGATDAADSVIKYYSDTFLCASKYLQFMKSRLELTSLYYLFTQFTLHFMIQCDIIYAHVFKQHFFQDFQAKPYQNQ